MSLNHVHLTCATRGCAAVITVHPGEEERLRRTGESFYCPAGHMTYFPLKRKDTEADKLRREVTMLKKNMDHWRGRWEASQETRKGLIAGLSTCPLGCGYQSTRRLPWMPGEDDLHRFMDRVGGDMAAHLLSEHNATRRPVALLNAGEASPTRAGGDT